MSVICLIDQTEHESVEALHAYLKAERYKRSSYYMEYHKVFDLQTGEQIPFKDSHMNDIEGYLSQEFASKTNLKAWFKDNPEKAKDWAIDWLKKRKEKKGLIYAPSQAELRSLICPSMPYYDSIGGYYSITAALGFKSRYTDEELIFTPLPADATIITDSREQKPLRLKSKTIVAKVDEADYALSPPYDKGIYVDRKSLGDFCGTMSGRKIARVKSEDSNLARFDRELARATDKNHYIVMLVEENINNALGFDYLPHMKHVKASPNYIWRGLRDLLNKYPLNFQVIFANGRVDAASKLIKLFELGEQVMRIDLQYAVERKLL